MFDAMMKDKKRVTPKAGFNVVGVDDFEMPGEQLYIVSHHDTRPEAEAVVKKFVKQNPDEAVHIYGPDGEV